MRPARYRYGTTLAFGTDGEPSYSEVDVEVSYEVSFGTPESGRFGSPENYDPGSGDEVHSIRLETVEGKPRPWLMGFGFLSDDDFAEMVAERLGSDEHVAAMVAEAAETDLADRDAYEESRWEERRLEDRA